MSRQRLLQALAGTWLLLSAILIAGLGAELWLRLERRASLQASERFRRSNVFFANLMELNAGTRSLWAKPWFKYRPGARAEVVVGGERFRIEMNSHGYRTHEFDVPKPPGLVRVICIGGSTTVAGRTNEETYPAFLEAKLRARHPGLPVEVLNLGISGVTTQHWRERLDRVLEYEPDVIVQYDGINDIYWLHFRRYARAHWVRRWAYRSLLLERLFPFPVEEMDPYLEETLSNLGAVARACRDRGVGYLVGSFATPDPRRTVGDLRRHLDVNTEFWTRFFPMHSFGTWAAILQRYNRSFEDFVQRQHLAHVLVHRELDDPALFIDVCHFTPAGIERLAEAFLPEVDALVQETPGYRQWARGAASAPASARQPARP